MGDPSKELERMEASEKEREEAEEEADYRAEERGQVSKNAITCTVRVLQWCRNALARFTGTLPGTRHYSARQRMRNVGSSISVTRFHRQCTEQRHSSTGTAVEADAHCI